MADKKTKAEESGEQLKDAGLGKTDMLRDSENEEQGAREDPAEEQPRWCRCGKCRPMPTEQENICCSNDDASECFVNSQQFQSLLTPDPLGNNDQVRSNGAYRHEAYRQFTFERHGPLGRGNRRVVPSCVVLAIRSMYPSPEGTYTGFIPSE